MKHVQESGRWANFRLQNGGIRRKEKSAACLLATVSRGLGTLCDLQYHSSADNDEKRKLTSVTAKVEITSLNPHLLETYSDTRYDFVSMTTKSNPHCPYASGDTRKEELTKRLCSLVDKSQDSCKKVPSAKNAPTDQSSERPMEAKGKGKEHGDLIKFRGWVWGSNIMLKAKRDLLSQRMDKLWRDRYSGSVIVSFSSGLIQTIEKASAKKLPHSCRGSLTRTGQSLEG